MAIKHLQRVTFLLMALCFATGCKPPAVTQPVQPAGYFKTDYQDESQFIVETIVSAIAEQVYHAKLVHPPEASAIRVFAIETPDSAFGSPSYDLTIDLDASHRGLKIKLHVNGPIWSPEVYDPVTAMLAKAVGLATGRANDSNDSGLLARLLDTKATTLEKENQKLSQALESDFTNANLHAQAAVILGAFMLREHSGDFYEIRSPLCQMTAQLALARYLAGGTLDGLNGCMAGVLLQTLMNNEASALEQLKSINATNMELKAWSRALQARNTGDYRPLEKVDALSRIESIEWFCALEGSANTDIAWSKLSDVQKRIPDFVRIAQAHSFSVGAGHELLALSLPLELEEISSVYELSQQKKLTKKDLVPALNHLPEGCLSTGADHQTHVNIINWGLWAGFLQRQLCHALENNFDFLERKWGVPDEAQKFCIKSDELFGELRLYPFVRRFNCTDVAAYHKSVDDGFKVTVATPQLVPAECWNNLCYEFSPTQNYQPNPNPHVNEWHKHNPPPGTAYDIPPRLNHPSLTSRSDSIALLEKLHDVAPYDGSITRYIWKHKYKSKPTYEQAIALFQPKLAYDHHAMERVAEAVMDQPAKYEELLSKAAALNPADYFELGDYFEERNPDKAAAYIEKGNALDPDSVRASYHASWLISYYLKNGKLEAARREADFAGEVYSYVGLQAKAEFLEATGDNDGAFEWYAKIEERYEKSQPLIAFYIRHKTKTGSTTYDGRMHSRVGQLFPNGIEKAALKDFKSPPEDGTLIRQATSLAKASGLKVGDVIVAVNGTRSHNFEQYICLRDVNSAPEMNLIVWQDGHYLEIKASPPNHRFGGDFGDYVK